MSQKDRMKTVFRAMTVDMELSNSRDITISTCGGGGAVDLIVTDEFSTVVLEHIHIHITYNNIYGRLIHRAGNARQRVRITSVKHLRRRRRRSSPVISIAFALKLYYLDRSVSLPPSDLCLIIRDLGETRFQCRQMFQCRSRRLFIMGLCIIIIFI